MSNNLVKKVTASVAALSIVMSIVSPVVGVKANDASVEAANRLAALGVIVDNAANPSAYNLDGSITRREMLKVMMNLSSVEVTNTCEGKFADLPTTDWGCKYAEAALKAGFIAANTNFRPNDLVSKSEALKMIMQAKNLAKKDGVEPWQKAYADAAVEAGVIEKAFTDYTAVAKRSMVVVTADAAVTSTSTNVDGDDTEIDLGDIFGEDVNMGNSTGTTSTGTTTNPTSTGTTTPTTNVGNGALELSLNPASPAYGAQIPNVGTVRFAKVDFTAGSADVTLNSVELKKVGLASVDSSTKVFFEKDGRRVSSRVGFTSEGSLVLSFTPAYVVKAGSTETLDLFVELNSSNTGVDYEFTSGKVVASAANVSGSFTTPKLRTTNYAVAPVTFNVTSSNTTHNASDALVELGAFTLYNGDTKSEQTDVALQSITLRNNGSASLTSLADVQLVRNGVVVSKNFTVDSKNVTFSVNDTVKEGVTATYYVKARIADVERTDDTYQFELRNASDLNAVEVTNGFRSTVKITNAVLRLYTVKGGEVRFARDTAVELSKSYAPGSSEVVLMKGTIDAKNPIKLEDVVLAYDIDNSKKLSDYFTTVNLVIGGTSFSTSAPDTVGDGNLNFDGTVYVTGKVDVKLYANLKSTATGNVKFAEMKLSNFKDRRYVSNDDSFDSGIGSISGVNVKVEDSSLNVTRNDGLGNTKLAVGSKNVTLFGANLTSTQGNAINVSSLTFDVSNTAGSEQLNNVFTTLYVNGSAVASETVKGSTVKFDGFNTEITKDKKAEIVVKADLSDSFENGNLKLALTALDAVDTLNGGSIALKSTINGATFTIATADAEFASSDNNPKTSLLEAGKNDYKVFAFKMTGKNDTVKVKEVTLTGTNLDKMSDFRLVNASNVVVASSSSATSTKVTFENIDTVDASVAMDKSTTFYVVANANTNVTGDVALTLDSVKIAGTNGKEVSKDTNVKSNTHFVAENVLVVAKSTNNNKSLSTSAMVFTVTASGKDSVSLKSFNFNTIVTGYDNNGQIVVYKDSVSAANKVTATENNTVDAGATVTFIVTVENAQKNQQANTISYEVQLKDIETSEISNVSKYLNAWSFPFVETINN